MPKASCTGMLVFCTLGPEGPDILISVFLELLEGRAWCASSAGHQGRPSSETNRGSVPRKHEWTRNLRAWIREDPPPPHALASSPAPLPLSSEAQLG